MAEQEEKVGGKRKAEPEKKDKKDKKETPSASAGDTVNKVRNVVATVVWVLAVLAAVILAAGALVIVLDFNEKNGVVKFFRETADNLNFLGELKSFDAGKSAESKHDALVKTVLVNWGICAVVYLVIGKVLERLIRP
jgi:hypothetical protein